MIHKSRIPDDVKRGYLFEQAVLRLASWWADTFFTVRPTGHLRSRTFEDVQRVLLSNGLFDLTDKGKGKALYEGVDSPEDLFEDDQVEVVRSAKSLMKHALMRSGSRDVSSQLFTALCRALGIPARLVVSLQSVPWQANVGRSKTLAKQKGSDSKGKAVEPRDAEDGSEDVQQVGVSQQNGYSSGDDVQIVTDAANKTTSTRPNGKGKMSNTVQLRISKSSGQRLGSSNPPGAPLSSQDSFVDLTVTTMTTQQPRIHSRLHLYFGLRSSHVPMSAGSLLTLYAPSSTSARFWTRPPLAPHHARELRTIV
jgi:xeroderma pigmentosum group C-complementing protein